MAHRIERCELHPVPIKLQTMLSNKRFFDEIGCMKVREGVQSVKNIADDGNKTKWSTGLFVW